VGITKADRPRGLESRRDKDIKTPKQTHASFSSKFPHTHTLTPDEQQNKSVGSLVGLYCGGYPVKTPKIVEFDGSKEKERNGSHDHINRSKASSQTLLVKGSEEIDGEKNQGYRR